MTPRLQDLRARLPAPAWLLIAALILGVGWACGDTLVSVIAVDRVEIDPPADSMFLDESRGLAATAKDAEGNTLQGRDIEWSSEAADIAAVDDGGLVRGLAPGRTTISATVEGVRGNASIAVLRWPLLGTDRDTVRLEVITGEADDRATDSLGVRNLGDGRLGDLAADIVYAGTAADWLSAAMEGDTAVVLTADGSALDRGTYEAVVALSASNAVNGPEEITVQLEVFRNNPAPSLTGVTPDTVRRESTEDVELTGAGFLAGVTTVDLGPGITLNSVDLAAPDRLVASVTVARDAALGPRDVVVHNPAPGGGTATLTGGLVVAGQNPFPTLQELDPPDGHRETTFDVEVVGTGFLEDVTTIDFGHGISVDGLTVTADTTLTATITIGAEAAAGPRDVRISNPPPGGGIATRPDAFTVLGTNPEPTLATAAPDTARRDRTLDLVLTGSGFASGYTSVDLGADIVVNETTFTSNTSLSASITVQPGAALGPRDVRVVNLEPGGGTATLADALTILVGDVSASASSVSVSPDTVVADSASVATALVEVRDAAGDAIGDLADAFEIDVDSSVEVETVVETPTRGTYMFSLRSKLAQAATLVVAVNGVALAERPIVEFVAGTATEANSSVSVSNLTPRADGMAAAGVTVTLVDEFLNPVTGLTGTDFVIDLGATSALAGPISDIGGGQYTFDVTNTVAEDVTVTVTAQGVTLLDTPTIVFQAGGVSASQSTVMPVPTTGVIADGTDASTVTVTVRDANGNLIDDLTDADFTVDAGGATATAVTPTPTVDDGEYTFDVTSLVASTFTIVVTAGTIELDQQPTITFDHGDVSSTDSEVTANPATGVTADGVATSTVTVLLKDANLNPIPDTTLSIVVSGTAQTGAVTQPTPGEYQFTVTNETAETVTVTVSVGATQLTDQPTIAFTAGTVDANLSSAAADSATMTAGKTSTVTVDLLDAKTNPVTGEAGTFSIVFTTGTATAGTVTETAPGSGVYEFTVTSETVGTVTVQITAGGITLADEPVIEITAAIVDALESSISAPATADVETGS